MKNMDLKILNGEILRQMIISGANNLFNHYPQIDALNVFPVPDGDTGTNMNLTLTSGSKEIINARNDSVYDVAKLFSRGLLMGARGNSGVILSQIFRGFAQGLEGKSDATVEDFAIAFKKASGVAYKAVMKPVEGTILTVIRESADALFNKKDSLRTIAEAVEVLCNESKESLERTPDLLPVLKEVGVVDSGGAGLCKIFEGMYAGLTNEVIERKSISRSANSVNEDSSNIESYCVNVRIQLMKDEDHKVFDEKRFRNVLEGIGTDIDLLFKNDVVSVHLHTQKPGNVLNSSQAYGKLIEVSVMDIAKHTTIIDPVEKEKKENALVVTSVGEGLSKLFSSLNVSYIVSGGQSMNPSTEDFVEAIKIVNAKNVFILPNNKNIIMAAEQASSVTEDCRVIVIPSKSISQGLVAAINFDPNEDTANNEERMRESIGTVKSGQVTFAIKDTKIDNITIKKDEFMGIFDGKIVCSRKDKNDAVKNLLYSMIDNDSCLVTIIYGEDVTKEEAQEIAKTIENKYGLDVEVHQGGQPVYSYFVSVE